MDRKVEGEFTSWIMRTRGKPLTVVNIEITKNDDFRERRVGKNVFYFGVKIVEEFRIVGRVRR